MKLSTKITMWVLIILGFIIVLMSIPFYMMSKSFYKDHITTEVEHRLSSHSEVIEENDKAETIEQIMRIERLEDVHFVLFDPSISPIVASDHIPSDWMGAYQQWINDNKPRMMDEREFPYTDYVEIGIDLHIPHVWSMQPIWIEGELEGYLFIDQDTVEFERTQIQLIKLIILMGTLSFLIGLLFTIYLTKKISNPLRAMGKATSKIAQGQFDTKLNVRGDDEVGQLSRDITKMATQLKDYRDSRQQFLSHISHDLRTPLTFIKGYSALMKEAAEVNEEEWRKHVDVIYQEANRMEYLVRDLFQLTKLEEGKLEVELESINLVEWLRTLIDQRQSTFEQHHLSWEVHYEETDIYACIDRRRMEQVIHNLLENSIRYTKSGGKIMITMRRTDQHAVLSVEDTGIGIPEEELPYIWERFYRVEKSRSREHGGTGLGLAIVKKLVELQEGKIQVSSEKGKGTRFDILFPIRPDR